MAIPNQRGYLIQQIIQPSTLALNTVFLTIRNTSVDSEIRIASIRSQATFVGVAGLTGSVFGFQRLTATPSGGSILTPSQFSSADAAPSVEIRFANAGLSGVTPGSNGTFHHIGVASAVGSTTPPQLHFEDENPFRIVVGDCLALFAATGLIAGALVTIGVSFYQVP